MCCRSGAWLQEARTQPTLPACHIALGFWKAQVTIAKFDFYGANANFCLGSADLECSFFFLGGIQFGHLGSLLFHV